tara:strand:+ start:550 stop:1212 length:663 start_codon:yes stop_codon:yes gene_type:complete
MKSNILFPVLLTIFLSFTNLTEAQNYFYSEVENLSVRREPDLKSKRIAKLTEGERVTDLGRTSRNEISVKLRGTRTSGPFFLIRTRKGIEGWAYSRGLSNRPVYVEDYICIIAFNKYGGVNNYNILNGLRSFSDCFDRDENYSFITKTSGFKEINIKNRYGEIIGVENISRIVDKYKEGLVILEKGKKAVYKNPGEYGYENIETWLPLNIYDKYGNCDNY